MIVVDTNVVAYLYLPSQFTPLAEQLLLKDAQWAAPLLWRSELRNVLALYLRKKLIKLDQACAIQSQAENLLATNEWQMNSTDVLRFADQSGLTAYDCEFIALADQLGTKLVSTDKKVLRAFPTIAVALRTAAT